MANKKNVLLRKANAVAKRGDGRGLASCIVPKAMRRWAKLSVVVRAMLRAARLANDDRHGFEVGASKVLNTRLICVLRRMHF